VCELCGSLPHPWVPNALWGAALWVLCCCYEWWHDMPNSTATQVAGLLCVDMSNLLSCVLLTCVATDV
jgi:hypothetical protein